MIFFFNLVCSQTLFIFVYSLFIFTCCFQSWMQSYNVFHISLVNNFLRISFSRSLQQMNTLQFWKKLTNPIMKLKRFYDGENGSLRINSSKSFWSFGEATRWRKRLGSLKRIFLIWTNSIKILNMDLSLKTKKEYIIWVFKNFDCVLFEFWGQNFFMGGSSYDIRIATPKLIFNLLLFDTKIQYPRDGWG